MIHDIHISYDLFYYLVLAPDCKIIYLNNTIKLYPRKYKITPVWLLLFSINISGNISLPKCNQTIMN